MKKLILGALLVTVLVGFTIFNQTISKETTYADRLSEGTLHNMALKDDSLQTISHKREVHSLIVSNASR